MPHTDELIERLARAATPLPAAPRPPVLFARWVLVALLYLAAVLACGGTRNGLSIQLASPAFLAEIVLLGGVVAAGLWGMALLSFPDLYQKRRLALAPLLLAPLAIPLFLCWHAEQPPAPLPTHDITCLLTILALAVLPAAWWIRSMRRLASTRLRASAVLVLLTALTLAALALRLSEPTDSIAHVLRWHYGPVLAFSALGLLLGRRLLRW